MDTIGTVFNRKIQSMISSVNFCPLPVYKSLISDLAGYKSNIIHHLFEYPNIFVGENSNIHIRISGKIFEFLNMLKYSSHFEWNTSNGSPFCIPNVSDTWRNSEQICFVASWRRLIVTHFSKWTATVLSHTALLWILSNYIVPYCFTVPTEQLYVTILLYFDT